MKDGKYSVMIVEDQQMPKALFSHFVESSDKFYLQVAIENASVADIVCTCTPVDLILMDVVTENGESGLEAAAKIKAKFPKTKIIVVTSMPECSYPAGRKPDWRESVCNICQGNRISARILCPERLGRNACHPGHYRGVEQGAVSAGTVIGQAGVCENHGIQADADGAGLSGGRLRNVLRCYAGGRQLPDCGRRCKCRKDRPHPALESAEAAERTPGRENRNRRMASDAQSRRPLSGL